MQIYPLFFLVGNECAIEATSTSVMFTPAVTGCAFLRERRPKNTSLIESQQQPMRGWSATEIVVR